MISLSKILNTLFPPVTDYTPIFPYSTEPATRREQIWQNLQHGLLVEDTGRFIYWDTPFNGLYKYKEKDRSSVDRHEWYFGDHEVLLGYKAKLEAMKWSWKSWRNPVAQIYARLGMDYQGQKNFDYLHGHLTLLFGEPDVTDLKKWGDFDLGEVTWKKGRVQVSLIAIEMFAARYTLLIGLIKNPNG